MPFLSHPFIWQIVRRLLLISHALLWVVCMVIAEKKFATRLCQKIQINIIKDHGHPFLNEKVIYHHLAAHIPITPHHTLLQDIAIKAIEEVIKSHKFVRACSVNITWRGLVNITVFPKRALARLIVDGVSTGYVDEIGEIIPLSNIYTPRVLILSSKSFRTLPLLTKLGDQPVGEALVALLHTIDRSPFLKAQINHIHVNKKNEVVLYMQLTRHKVYFGKIENVDAKMEKLKLFYRAILPHKRWDTYKKIVLKFDNQIVCE